MNSINVKELDYSRISSLAELDVAINMLRTKISIQEDVIKEDADSLFNLFNNAKMLWSSAVAMFVGGGLTGVIARCRDVARYIIESIRVFRTGTKKAKDDIYGI